MSDAHAPGETWASYLRRMTKRPGWSVAKLARDSGIHRATIFKWISGEPGATVDSVRRIAQALGDDPENAFRAVRGAAIPSATADEELALIDRAPVDDALKDVMRQKLLERRERERLDRLAYLQDMIDVAKRED
jgi:transcriptional regulator with XRE-family HTH domain